MFKPFFLPCSKAHPAGSLELSTVIAKSVGDPGICLATSRRVCVTASAEAAFTFILAVLSGPLPD